MFFVQGDQARRAQAEIVRCPHCETNRPTLPHDKPLPTSFVYVCRASTCRSASGRATVRLPNRDFYVRVRRNLSNCRATISVQIGHPLFSTGFFIGIYAVIGGRNFVRNGHPLIFKFVQNGHPLISNGNWVPFLLGRRFYYGDVLDCGGDVRRCRDVGVGLVGRGKIGWGF